MVIFATILALFNQPLAQTYDIISDRTAVQAILDSNGMTTTSWGDVSVVRNNRIAELTLTGIHVLPDTVKVLTALEKLTIIDSLTTLPQSLGKLHNLRTLAITRCRITALPDTMSSMDSLKVIRLYAAPIRKFPITALCPPRLDSLFITKTFYDTLPVSISGIASLKALSVDSTPISYISNDIGDLKALTSLTIKNEDSLPVLPDSVGALSNLRTFNVSANPRLSALPLSICKLKWLTSINIYHDAITILPDSISTLLLLDTLDIEYNNIRSIAESFSYSYIKTIFPGKNAICPDALSSSLRAWMNAHAQSDKAPGTWDQNQNCADSLGYNIVTDRAAVKAIFIANGLDTAKVDSVFSVRNNRIVGLKLVDSLWVVSEVGRTQPYAIRGNISILPDSIRSLTALESLTVVSGNLTNITEAIGCLVKLTYLSFSSSGELYSMDDGVVYRGCRFSKLPDTICCLRNLRVLECAANSQFTALPDSIGKLVNLVRLNLHQDNLFSKLPQSICNCKNLQTLDLGQCSLSTIPDCIGSFASLSNIDVYGNKLMTIPETFITSKTKIYLSNNYICASTLSPGLYQWIDTHTAFDRCDCNNGGCSGWVCTRWWSNQHCESYIAINYTKDSIGWIVGDGGTPKYIGGKQYGSGISHTLHLSNHDTTWTIAGNDTVGGGFELTDAIFTDSLHGWTVKNSYGNPITEGRQCYYSIFGTSSGAKTWNAQLSQISGYRALSALTSIFFIDSTKGWAVGRDLGFEVSSTNTWDIPLIYSTKNGGFTWSHHDSNVLMQIRQFTTNVFFHDSLFGWAVGQGGLILTSTDSGTTWKKQVSGTTNNLNKVFFVDSANGWTVGDSTILHTADSGITWVAQACPSNKSLKGLFFIDKDRGWAVGDSGTVLRTTNGGAYWGVVNVGTKSHLKAVAFTDSLNGWIVGADRTIIHITDGGKVGVQGRISNAIFPKPLSMKISAAHAGILYVKYNLPTQGKVQLTVTDIMGRSVVRREEGMCEAGSGMMRLTAQRLAQGYYFVTLRLTTEQDKIVSVVRCGFVMTR
jgi:photosystem II stability/assembly factor-like uncharacterized protein/Leucine-rich repeat (LRR) protein